LKKGDWYTTKIREFTEVHFIDPKSTRPNIDGLIIAGSADLKYDLGDKLDQRLKDEFLILMFNMVGILVFMKLLINRKILLVKMNL